MVWTNDKHSSYLGFLEASFVKQLHCSLSMRACHPQKEMLEPCPTPQLPAKGHISSHQVRDLICFSSSSYGVKSIDSLASISYLYYLFSFRFYKMAAAGRQTMREVTLCWIALLILVISWEVHCYTSLHLHAKAPHQHFLFHKKLCFPMMGSAWEVIPTWLAAPLVNQPSICCDLSSSSYLLVTVMSFPHSMLCTFDLCIALPHVHASSLWRFSQTNMFLLLVCFWCKCFMNEFVFLMYVGIIAMRSHAREKRLVISPLCFLVQ